MRKIEATADGDPNPDIIREQITVQPPWKAGHRGPG